MSVPDPDLMPGIARIIEGYGEWISCGTHGDQRVVAACPVCIEANEVAVSCVTRLQDALRAIKANAESWHGVESEGTGADSALRVIADWCDDALAEIRAVSA